MSQMITLNVRDKIASCITEKPIVCGNSDYEIHFDFDEEWNGHEVKTAVFTVNGKSVLKPFSGTVCKIPELNNTLILWVGVFAGTIDDGTLSTSTPALVHCVPCATDGEHLPFPPPDDVYNQIVELCDEAVSTANDVKERADNGEFNGKDGADGKDGKDGADGKDGKDGADGADGKTAHQYAVDGGYEGSEEDFARDTANLTIAKESAEQAASNASTSEQNASTSEQNAIASAESAQESADRANAILEDVAKEADTSKKYANNVFANALEGHKSGQSVSASDVSPIEHELDIKITGENVEVTKVTRLGKNFADLAGLPDDLKRSPSNFNTKTGTSYEITDDNKIILKAPSETATGANVSTKILFKDLFPDARVGMTLRLSADLEVSKGADTSFSYIVYLSGANTYFVYNKASKNVAKTVTEEMLNSTLMFYTTTTVGGTATLSNFQMELGENATEYEPYKESVEVTADANGNVSGLMSVSPSMTITTDNGGAVIDCTYNRDINKAFEEITQAMVSMGANI